VHGYLRRDGSLVPIATGTHHVIERSPTTGYPIRVVLDGTDADGRTFNAEGFARNSLGWFINPNLYTVNGLIEWSLDGETAFGEDHDNWSAASIRAFHRARRS
jgi:hypothetical protein